MFHIRKSFMALISLFVLTACGMNNEPTEDETSVGAAEELNEGQKEVSPEEESKTDQEDEVSDAPTTEEEKSKIQQEDEDSDASATEETSTAVFDANFKGIYDELNGKSFIFSSGVGAWRTGFTFTNNGQFSGTYSDANGSEMFVSDFLGRFEIIEEVDEYTYQLVLDEFQVTSDTGKEEKDGDMTVTYVDSPHGFPSGSHRFELYLPYKPKNEVSEEYLSWVYGQANNDHDFLNSFGLYNISHQFGMEELLD